MKILTIGSANNREDYLSYLRLKRDSGEYLQQLGVTFNRFWIDPGISMEESDDTVGIEVEAESEKNLRMWLLKNWPHKELADPEGWVQADPINPPVPRPQWTKLFYYLKDSCKPYQRPSSTVLALLVSRLEQAILANNLPDFDNLIPQFIAEAKIAGDDLEALKQKMYTYNFFCLHI